MYFYVYQWIFLFWCLNDFMFTRCQSIRVFLSALSDEMGYTGIGNEGYVAASGLQVSVASLTNCQPLSQEMQRLPICHSDTLRPSTVYNLSIQNNLADKPRHLHLATTSQLYSPSGSHQSRVSKVGWGGAISQSTNGMPGRDNGRSLVTELLRTDWSSLHNATLAIFRLYPHSLKPTLVIIH